jgi:hypothetical protein
MDAYEDRAKKIESVASRIRSRMRYWRRELNDVEIELGGTPRRSRVRDAQAMYLAWLEHTNGKHAACDAADISPSRVKSWEREDVIFSTVLPAAKEAALDRLVSEATRRAVDGVEKAVRHQGRLVGFERQYSDALLQTLLKGLDQARFGNGVGGSDANSETKARRDAAKAILAGDETLLAQFEALADELSKRSAGG